MQSTPVTSSSAWRVTAAAVLAVAIVGWPAQNVSAKATDADTAETHCVVEVVGTQPTGEFILSDPVCFAAFSDAVAAASDGQIELPKGSTGSIVFRNADTARALSSFTLGIHYDGFNGSGSSISVVGSSCTGGWWNTPSSWRNRISSTYNGCARLRHYDNPNKSGSYQDTYGAGTTDNLGSLNNRAESVSYHSS
jgi:hypothetical protein